MSFQQARALAAAQELASYVALALVVALLGFHSIVQTLCDCLGMNA